MSEKTDAFTVFYPTGEERTLTSEGVSEFIQSLTRTHSDCWHDAVVVQGNSENSGWVHAFFAVDFGWLIACCGDGDAVEYFLAASRDLSGQTVTIKKAGGFEEYRKEFFVPESVAIAAIEEFLTTRERNATLHWFPVGT